MLHLDLPRLINEQGGPMRLLAAWLHDAHEGANFYSGTGGEAVSCTVPPRARGYRLRRWPSEGLAPEYLDWRFESRQPSAITPASRGQPQEEATP